MIDMRLNLNDNIKVKLTDHGKDIYYHRFDQLNKAYGRIVNKPSYPKVDKNGYTTFQLWCFMELYGVHIGMTLPNVIEPLDIVFDAPTIEPEQKTGYWTHYLEEGLPWKCSECDSRFKEPYHYCPNCGERKKNVVSL